MRPLIDDRFRLKLDIAKASGKHDVSAGIAVVVGSVVWIAVPPLCLWVIIYGLMSGEALARGGKYSRKKEPIFYWLTLSVYGALLIFWIGISAAIGLNVFRRG